MELKHSDVESFVNQCLKLEEYLKNRLIAEETDYVENTAMRISDEVGCPDEIDGEIFVDEDGVINRQGALYLLDKFDPEGDRENISFDIGLYKGFESAVFLTCHFLGINKEFVNQIVEGEE